MILFTVAKDNRANALLKATNELGKATTWGDVDFWRAAVQPKAEKPKPRNLKLL